MAWENITLQTNMPNIVQCNVTNFSFLDMENYPNDLTNYIETPTNYKDNFLSGVWFGESPYYVENEKGSGSQPSCVVTLYMGSAYPLSYGNENLDNSHAWGYIACVNHVTQKGFFALVIEFGMVIHFWAGVQPPTNSTLVSGTNIAWRSLMYTLLTQNIIVSSITSNGGGATHIAKVTGQLKDLSFNLSDILIVSGGGGGGMLIGDTVYPGADAGGIAGNSDNSADQTTGYAFGQGENG